MPTCIHPRNWTEQQFRDLRDEDIDTLPDNHQRRLADRHHRRLLELGATRMDVARQPSRPATRTTRIKRHPQQRPAVLTVPGCSTHHGQGRDQQHRRAHTARPGSSRDTPKTRHTF